MIQMRPFCSSTKSREVPSPGWLMEVGELNILVATWTNPKVGQSTESPNAVSAAHVAARARAHGRDENPFFIRTVHLFSRSSNLDVSPVPQVTHEKQGNRVAARQHSVQVRTRRRTGTATSNKYQNSRAKFCRRGSTEDCGCAKAEATVRLRSRAPFRGA